MSKIAIYGGAFNPPTLGHVHVIKQIFQNTDITKIIIAPDGTRLDKNYEIETKNRKDLVNIFIEDLKKDGYNVELEDYFLEGKNKTDTTTYEVDKYFINKLTVRPYHIFGTDISTGISNWSGNPNKYIQKKLKKIFINRKGYIFNDFDLENYTLVKTYSSSNISSSKVRQAIKEGSDLKDLVSGNIKNYIVENNLYK